MDRYISLRCIRRYCCTNLQLSTLPHPWMQLLHDLNGSTTSKRHLINNFAILLLGLHRLIITIGAS